MKCYGSIILASFYTIVDQCENNSLMVANSLISSQAVDVKDLYLHYIVRNDQPRFENVENCFSSRCMFTQRRFQTLPIRDLFSKSTVIKSASKNLPVFLNGRPIRHASKSFKFCWCCVNIALILLCTTAKPNGNDSCTK